jgi:hypothetical protein
VSAPVEGSLVVNGWPWESVARPKGDDDCAKADIECCVGILNKVVEGPCIIEFNATNIEGSNLMGTLLLTPPAEVPGRWKACMAKFKRHFSLQVVNVTTLRSVSAILA